MFDCFDCHFENHKIDTTKYKQVTLTKDIKGNKALYVCWIPNEFAIVGKVIRLSANLFDNWTVREVHEHISTEVVDPRKDGTFLM